MKRKASPPARTAVSSIWCTAQVAMALVARRWASGLSSEGSARRSDQDYPARWWAVPLAIQLMGAPLVIFQLTRKRIWSFPNIRGLVTRDALLLP